MESATDGVLTEMQRRALLGQMRCGCDAMQACKNLRVDPSVYLNTRQVIPAFSELVQSLSGVEPTDKEKAAAIADSMVRKALTGNTTAAAMMLPVLDEERYNIAQKIDQKLQVEGHVYIESLVLEHHAEAVGIMDADFVVLPDKPEQERLETHERQTEVECSMKNAAVLAVRALIEGEHMSVLVFCPPDAELWHAICEEMPPDVAKVGEGLFSPHAASPEWHLRRMDIDTLMVPEVLDAKQLTIVLDPAATQACIEHLHKAAPHADVIIARTECR